MGASFLLNQLQDVEPDKANEKLFIVAEGHISQRAVLLEIVALVLPALFLAWKLSPVHFLFTAGFILLTGYLYNYPPLVLKDRPLGSLAANSLMGWFAFALGWAAVKPLSGAVVIDALPYVFLNTALYFFTTLPDVEGDRQSQKRTLAVLKGTGFVIRLAFVLFVFALVSAWRLKDFTLLLIAALSAPFFIRAFWNRTVRDAVRATKFTILFFAVVICFKLPFFFILMVTGFYATRWYFKQRFNYDYPNFKG
jgi:4-hydroxybenzoate polyprenyltransferase